MAYNPDSSTKLSTFGSKFLDSSVSSVPPSIREFKQHPDDLLAPCQGANLPSTLGTTCTTTFNMTSNTGSSYEVPARSYSYSSPYNTAVPQPPLKFSQSSASYIRVSESIVEGLNGTSGYDSNFMIKEEPWDQPSDTKNNFVSTPLQLHFNDSPYSSPNNKSDKSSVHSPSDCLVSPFTSPTPHFSFDATSPGYLVSNDYPSSLHRDTTPLHLNGFVRIEKRGKRGRPRGSKNRSTLAKTIDPSLFPAGALFPGKKRGRGSRLRGQNPGIRARVNYRAVNGYPKSLDSSDSREHINKRGSSTRGRGAMRMCKICVNCLRTDDCAECVFCKDKSKFGGSNKLKQKCLKKQCVYKGKFIEHDNPTEATSRYIVQKKSCANPPPLSHPPLSDVMTGSPLIPTSPSILDKPVCTPPSIYCSQGGSYTLSSDHSPGFPGSSAHKFPYSEEPHSPFISNNDHLLDSRLNHSLSQDSHISYLQPEDHMSGVLSPHQKSPPFTFSPQNDHFSQQPEFLQDIPVKVWMQADLAKAQSYD